MAVKVASHFSTERCFRRAMIAPSFPSGSGQEILGDLPAVHTSAACGRGQLELPLVASKADVRCFAIEFAAPTKWGRQKPYRINCVAFPAIILSNKDR